MAALFGIFLGAAHGAMTNIVALVPAVALGIFVTNQRTAILASVAVNGLLYGFALLFLSDTVPLPEALMSSEKAAVWLGGMFGAGVAAWLAWTVTDVVKQMKRKRT